ncbi:hypothetical protein ACFLZ2_01505 [Candidatus Margulisiibacteriota bacterium]
MAGVANTIAVRKCMNIPVMVTQGVLNGVMLEGVGNTQAYSVGRLIKEEGFSGDARNVFLLSQERNEVARSIFVATTPEVRQALKKINPNISSKTMQPLDTLVPSMLQYQTSLYPPGARTLLIPPKERALENAFNLGLTATKRLWMLSGLGILGGLTKSEPILWATAVMTVFAFLAGRRFKASNANRKNTLGFYNLLLLLNSRDPIIKPRGFLKRRWDDVCFWRTPTDLLK